MTLKSNPFKLNTPNSKARTLLVGIGNEYAGDDGIGLFIARTLKATNLPGTLIECQSGDGALLIESWKNAQAAILFDAVHSNGPPGKIYRFEPRNQPIPGRLFNRSSHNFGVAEAVELARTLDRLPPHLIIYGIEGHCFKQGIGFSPGLEKAAQEVVEIVVEEICGASFISNRTQLNPNVA